MSKFSSYFRLMRPVNCFMIGFAVIVGATIANSSSLRSSLPNLAYGFTTGFMLTAASMAINDYYDREIDAVNEPSRPIPSGAVKPKEALAFASLLTVTGFVAAYLTSASCLFTAAVAWLLFVTYTTAGKRSGLPGNFLVSACVAIPFVYGSVAIMNEVRLAVMIFAAIAFLSNTGREVTKGIVDVRGDKSANVKTLAVRYGERKAAVAAAVLYLSSVLLSPTPLFLNVVSFWLIPLVTITDIGLVVSSITLVRDCSASNARKVKNVVLLWFMIDLLAFFVGALG